MLNDRYSARTGFGATVRQIRPENTLVIASSVSNGGGAALAAAEGDGTGLIDGVVVTEPQIVLPANLAVKVQRGNTPQPVIGRTLLDYTSFANVYGACAGLSPQLAGTPFQSSYATFFGFFASGRCAALKAQGLVTAADTPSQANEARSLASDSLAWLAVSAPVTRPCAFSAAQRPLAKKPKNCAYAAWNGVPASCGDSPAQAP